MNKVLYQSIGATLFLVGLVFYAGAGYLFWRSTETAPATAIVRKAIEDNCMAGLRSIFNFPPANAPRNPAQSRLETIAEGRIQARVEDIRDPQRALGDATAALGACPTKKFRSFCLGAQCPGEPGAPNGPRMVFVLENAV